MNRHMSALAKTNGFLKPQFAHQLEELEPRTFLSATAPVVSIVATDASADAHVVAGSLTGDPGQFTITRESVTSDALKVKLTIGGTAKNGKDYAKICQTVTIPANAASVTVTIAPFDNGQTQANTVLLSIVKASSYTISSANPADTVAIAQPTYTAADFWPMEDGLGVYFQSGHISFADVGGGQFRVNLPPDPTDSGAPLAFVLQQTSGGLVLDSKTNSDNTQNIYNPPLVWLPAVMQIGQTYSSSLLTGDAGTLKVLGLQTITCPLGTVRCLEVRTTFADRTDTVWLARGLGLVKLVSKRTAHRATTALVTAVCRPGSWNALSPLSEPSAWLGGGAINGKLYAFGGELANSSDSDSLMAYDPQTNIWTNRSGIALNVGESDCTSVTFGGKLYLFVDEGPKNYNNYADDNYVAVYDPATDEWTNLSAPKPARISSGPTVTYNGEIYFFGGEFWSNKHGGLTNTVEAYNPATNTWRVVTKLPRKLLGANVAVVGDTAYVLGGASGSSVSSLKPNTTTMAYNFATGQWTTKGLAAMPQGQFCPGDGGAAPVYDNKIYVVGGISKAGASIWASNSVRIYDPATNTWSIGPSLPEPLFYTLPVVIGNFLYVVGGTPSVNAISGGSGSDAVSDVWSISLL